MYLKRLELHGFKSFYEKTVFEFNRGITAVVGPNGSGKSNIADAVRWALGEQSVKILRGGRMEDVIFGGTESRRGMVFAEVTLVMDNSGGSLGMEGLPTGFGSEVSVSRRLYRSGESKYLINDTAVRLRDIHELFMDTGLGREGYSIIGQGRIEDVLSQKTEDRRALFEEAVGIIKYKTRRDEAVSKLEKERQSLVRVYDIIAEIEMQLEPMREQAEKAKKYLDIMERLKAVKINIYVNFLETYEAQERRANDTEQDLAAQISLAEEKREQRKAETETTQAKLILQAELVEKHLHGRSEILLSIQNTENEIKMQEMKHNYSDERRGRVLSDIEARKNAAAAFEAERLALLDKLAALTEEMITKDEEAAALRELLDARNEELAERERALESFNARHIEKLQGVTDIKSRIEGLAAAYSELELRKENLAEEQALLENERAEREKGLRDLSAELEKTNQNTIQAENDIRKFTTKKSEINVEYTELKAVFKSEQAELFERRQRYRILQDLEKSREGYGFSVKTVLEASAKNMLKGVHGAVGDLLTAPAEYETAVETALGGTINEIVVEDEAAAKKGIELLKSTKSGRATFLPLAAIKPRNLGQNKAKLISEPGILGAAADFVKAEAQYTNIVENFLGRVLVADNLDSAIVFSKKHGYAYKVVTLTGEVITPGGAITGGSANKRFGILSRKRELSELAQAISDGEAHAAKRNAQLDEISGKLSATSELLERAKVGLHELQIKKAAQESAFSREKSALDDIGRRILAFEKQDNELLARLTEVNTELRLQKNTQNAAETQIADLLAEIAGKQESLAESRKIRDNTGKSLNSLLVELSRLTEHAGQNEKSASKAAEAAEAAMAEAAALVDELENLDIEKEGIISRIEALKEKSAEQLSAAARAEEDIDAAQAEKTATEAELKALSEAEQEFYRLENRLNLEMERLRLRKESIKSEAERLHSEMWGEYNITPKQATDMPRLGLSPTRLKQEEQALKAELREMGGTVNVGAVEEERLINERYAFMTKQRDDIHEAEEQLKQVIDMLNSQMEARFLEQFVIIAENFKAVFVEMFGGGDGYLRLTDESDALNSGIEIIARPPGKALQNMNLLSGGERALCAIALLFAILRMKPSPFCVLDEIETSLDDANVRRFANFLKSHDSRAQFILITHRKGTMEAADTLYGVTMQEAGLSKLVSVNLKAM